MALELNQEQVGRKVEVLVATGEGKRNAETLRLSGRARDGRLVHFAPGDAAVRPGDVVETVVTYGAPHYVVADGPLISHRRTKAGDQSEAGIKPKTPGTSLGLPSFGAPSPLPVVVSGCGVQ
jgi:tRNA-2-methylthio-N6-dimethylallyladenosine synthase